jgi:hypothetical protein
MKTAGDETFQMPGLHGGCTIRRDFIRSRVKMHPRHCIIQEQLDGKAGFLFRAITRLPLLGQRSGFFRGGVWRISAGFRQFTAPNGM